jgi:DNA polymerase
MSRQEVAAHLQFLRDLGVTGVSRDPVWREREGDPAPVAPPAAGVVQSGGGHDPVAEGSLTQIVTLDALRAHIGPACTRCKLCKQGRGCRLRRRQSERGADVRGQAPGADETASASRSSDAPGSCSRRSSRRCSTASARTYRQRDQMPAAGEPESGPDGSPLASRSSTARSISSVRASSSRRTFAAKALLKTDSPISRLRGRVHDFRGGTKLIATFHPAFLLRSPDRKRDVWEDMKKVRALLADRD